jgi:hypothetical protein
MMEDPKESLPSTSARTQPASRNCSTNSAASSTRKHGAPNAALQAESSSKPWPGARPGGPCRLPPARFLRRGIGNGSLPSAQGALDLLGPPQIRRTERRETATINERYSPATGLRRPSSTAKTRSNQVARALLIRSNCESLSRSSYRVARGSKTTFVLLKQCLRDESP